MLNVDPGTFLAMVALVSASLFGAYWVVRQALFDAAKDIDNYRKKEGKHGSDKPKTPF